MAPLQVFPYGNISGMVGGMSTMSVATLGHAVRDARRAQHVTQAQLALRAGVGRRFVVDLESGHPRAELGKALTVMRVLGLRLDVLSSPVAVVDTKDGTVSFTAVTRPSGRPFFVPARLWTLDPGRATATVTLPYSVYWSGGDASFDLSDERDRQLAYRILLTEAPPDVMVGFLDGGLLSEMWDRVLLPPDVREAWQPVIDDYRGTRAA